MKIVVAATRSEHKIREIAEILRDLSIDIRPLSAFPGAPAVVEDGVTYLDNARKKAVVAARFTRHWALADDSGIEIDALGGRPGIHSARYAGPDATDQVNNNKLLEELRGVPPERRTARYRAVIVVASPDGVEIRAEGICEGAIANAPAGSSGFGYDPLFLVHGYGGKTMAELGMEIKNRISHRARALEKLRAELKKALD